MVVHRKIECSLICACQKAYSTYIIANLNDIIVVENHLAVGVVMY